MYYTCNWQWTYADEWFTYLWHEMKEQPNVRRQKKTLARLMCALMRLMCAKQRRVQEGDWPFKWKRKQKKKASAAPSAWWSCERALAPPAATWPLCCSTFHWCAKDPSNWEDWWCRRLRGRVDEQIRGFFLFLCFFFSFFGVDGGLLSVWLALQLSARRPSWSGPSWARAVTGIIKQLLRDILPLVFCLLR